MTKDLDANGIIRIGANIKEGDIMIGKITPKGETDPTPEEKLLGAIFFDKVGDVKDASLKAPPSLEGTVIDKNCLPVPRKIRMPRPAKDRTRKLDKDHERVLAELKEILVAKLLVLLKDKKSAGIRTTLNEEVVPAKTKFTQKMLEGIHYNDINPYGWTGEAPVDDDVRMVLHNYGIKVNEELGRYKRENSISAWAMNCQTGY